MTPSIRQATESDLRFVHSSWHTSHWKTWAHKHVERSVYNEGQDRRIDRIIKRGATVLVAYFPEVPDEVLGWACVTGDTLYYAYVKGMYRGRGIGRGLLPEGLRWYTHATDANGRRFAEKVGLKFNPFKLEHP